jgi:hypothetical protein
LGRTALVERRSRLYDLLFTSRFGRLRKAGCVLGQEIVRPRVLSRVGLVLAAVSVAGLVISARPGTHHVPNRDERAVTTSGTAFDELDDSHREAPGPETTSTQPQPGSTSAEGGGSSSDPTSAGAAAAGPQDTAPPTTEPAVATGASRPASNALKSLRGRVVYESEGQVTPGLYSAALDGSDERLLLATVDGRTPAMPDVSTDGLTVAYMRQPQYPVEVYEEIHLMSFDGRRDVRLPLPDGHWLDPRISPDGSRVVVTNESGGAWIVDVDGTDAQPLALDVSVYEGMSWAPDGERVAASATGPDGSGIYVIQIDTGSAELLAGGDGTSSGDPAWSPDGSEVVYWMSDGSSQGLVATNVVSRGTRKLADGELRLPSWSLDGRTLVVTAPTAPKHHFELWAIDRSGATLHRLGIGGGRTAQ